MSRESWDVNDVVSLLQVGRKTLSAWLHRGPARASVAAARGHGRRVLFSLDDVVELSAIAFVRRQGLSMRRARQVIEATRRLERPLSEYLLVTVDSTGEAVGYSNEQEAVVKLQERPGEVVMLPVLAWRNRALWIDDSTRLEAAFQEQDQKEAASIEAWGRFRDCWDLLNAGSKTLREVAKTDPWFSPAGWPEEQVDHLERTLCNLYILYAVTIARGQGLAACGDDDERYFQAASADLAQCLTDLYPASVPWFVAEGGRTRRECRDKWPPLQDRILGRVKEWVYELVDGLEVACTETVYCCGRCGRIGPAREKEGHDCRLREQEPSLRERMDSFLSERGFQ